MKRKILLLGHGGREHSIAKSLVKSEVELVSWSPIINPGIEAIATKIIHKEHTQDLDKSEISSIDLAIVGSERPLVEGITDYLTDQGIEVFGPNKKNSRIEGSKIYMRQLLTKHNIPGNVLYHVCQTRGELADTIESSHMVAIKPDGLTGGKGVKIFGDQLKTKKLIFDYAYGVMDRDGAVLIEELVTGIEFSLQAFVLGEKIIFLPLVKDYKRAYESDVGPNTGSMGSCSFVDNKLPYLTDEQIEEAKDILTKIILALNYENGDYKGPIYGQFMLTDSGLRLIEVNARLGDPEAINVLGLLDTPLMDIIDNLYSDDEIIDVKFSDKATCCVYIVPGGYPDKPEAGIPIELSFDDCESDKLCVIYASVTKEDNKLKTTKSRSVALLGFGASIDDAREQAYRLLPRDSENLRWRTDIASEFTTK
jgi:phosphoribosylamine--glycine ligase